MPRIAGANHQDAVRALQKVGFTVVRQDKHIAMNVGVAPRKIIRVDAESE